MKKAIGYIILGCLLNFSCKHSAKDQKEVLIQTTTAKVNPYSLLCDTPKFSEYNSSLDGYQSYFEYEQALKCARQQHKVLIAYFYTHSFVSCRPMERMMEKDEEIKRVINDNFVFAYLACDDKTICSNGDTLGNKNWGLLLNKFEIVATPYIIFLDGNEKVLGQTGMSRDREKFLKILKNAIAANN